jgi:hypothetical protein
MKKLLLIVSFLFCAFYSFAQGPFPQKQSIASPTTLLKINGASKDSLASILATWADTSAANANPYIKFYPGAQIRTLSPANTVWVRNQDANTWLIMEVGAGDIDVFLIAGQSNAVGNSGNPSAAPVPLAGTAFQFYNGSISAAQEPIGASDGSAWPSFAITYYKLTGRKICFVPAAANGSSMAAAANLGNGTWDTTGTLYSASVTLTNNAIAALRSRGYNPVFKGVLWSQGETDADGINRGTITQNTYSAAFAKLIKNYRIQFGSTISFNISRTGFRTDTIQTGFLSVQAAQSTLANPDSLINITYWNPPFFIQRSLMQGQYHYTQPGYNEMGRIMAEEYVNSTSNNWQTQNGSVYFKKGYVGVGDVIPPSPITIYKTGEAKALLIRDSLNDAVRIELENNRNGGLSGAAIRFSTSTGFKSQISQLSPSSIFGPNLLGIFTTDGLTMGSDAGDVDLYTGTGSSLSTANSKLRLKNSGQIAIGSNVNPDASAIFDVQGTTRGVLFPRLNTTQQNAISSPATGLLIYNTDSLSYVQYNGTAWRVIGGSGGSSTASSLQEVTNIGNTTDTSIVAGGVDAYSTYGTVWADNFARASFGANYGTNGAGVTYTFPGSAYLNVAGTAGAHTDYFYRLDSTNENKGSITATIVVNSKSASTAGIYIGWGGINALSTNHPVFFGITLTTGSNNMFFVAETAPFTYNDPQSLTINALDTIVLTLSRVDWTYTGSYYNATSKIQRSFTFTGVPSGGVLPFTPNGFSRPEFHTLGADVRVYNFSRISNESKYARNVWGYNSLQLGGNLTDLSQKMGYIACGNNEANVIYAAGGGSVGSYLNATYDEDLARYAAGGAENFWCQVSGNDSAFSVWNNVGKLALIAARDRWVAAGKRWIWIQPFPRNALNLTAVSDTVRAIATRLGDPLVPLFERFNVATLLPADWNAGDGVHLTATANRTAGVYIDSLFPQYTRQNAMTGTVKGYKGNFQSINFNSLQEWNFTDPAEVFTLPPDVNNIRINPSSTLAVFTIQLPSNVDSGHIYYINFGGQLTSGIVVTALTLSAATGQTITRMPFVEPVGGVTALPFGVGDMIICRYLNNGRWEATPIRTGFYTDLFIAGRRLGAGLNQTTQDNTVFGYASGNTISTGTDNSFFGNQAGQLNSTGVRNSFYGNESGMNTSTGQNNTAYGDESLRQGNGSNRTTFGYASCYNCTGSDVVAMGVNSMFSNTSGINNTAVGSGSSQNNQTGSGNVAIGANALFGISTNSHSFNTAVGNSALRGNTTGLFNIALGDSAGVTNTTGSRNILIGNNVTASSATAFAEMNIGGLLFATGITGSGTTKAGSLGIGTVPTSDRVSIDGNISLVTAGNKINIATGANASIGTSSAMVAGTITVNTTAVTANSKILLSVATASGTQGFLSVGTIVPGTSFVINSSGATDTSTINYLIIN